MLGRRSSRPVLAAVYDVPLRLTLARRRVNENIGALVRSFVARIERGRSEKPERFSVSFSLWQALNVAPRGGVNHAGNRFRRRLRFFGMAVDVANGYLDPRHWATTAEDLKCGLQWQKAGHVHSMTGETTMIDQYTKKAMQTLMSTGRTTQAVSSELNRFDLERAVAGVISASARCENVKKRIYHGKTRNLPVPVPVDVSRCDPDSLHCLVGLLGEVGELAESLVCWSFDATEEAVLSELGDVLYYLTMLAECTGNSLADVMTYNNAKLAARHGPSNA